MRKTFLAASLVCAVFLLASCAGDEDSAVLPDGPIMETMGVEGKVEFNGAVINTADYAVRSVYVVILIRDSEDNILDATSVLVADGEKLDAGESSFFSASLDFLPADAHSKEVEIYYDLVEE